MPADKVHPLEKKVPTAYSISTRTKIAFHEKCEELGISASLTVENLMLEFLK
jgi:hypothetical protein